MELGRLLQTLLLAVLACGVVLFGLTFSACGSGKSPRTTSTTKPAASQAMTPAKARALHANEMGEIPVLVYHLIGHTNSQFNRTPDEFRQDLVELKADDYYPINVRDLASGNIDVPAGKSPVVFTFDDSSEGQYRVLPGGSLDPNSAVALMNEAAAAGGWARRASFFPLIDVTPPNHDIFGQPDFSPLTFTIGKGVFTYGVFLNALVTFLLVAAAIYFVVVMPLNKLAELRARGADPTTKECPECLSEIPHKARKCAHCGSEQQDAAVA